jgi:hypothetical protein
MCLAGLVAVLLAGVAFPAGAQYSKLYRFSNGTGADQSSVSAVANGIEIITLSYAYPSGWLPASVNYMWYSGVMGTKITYSGTPVAAGSTVMIGWRTSDYSCAVRDLRWGGGQTVVPTQLGGTPGGGLVLYDYPNPGDLTMVLINDNTDPMGALTFPGVEFAVAGSELSLDQLGGLSEMGLVELRVATIIADISILRDEIAQAGAALPSPSGNSLMNKLEDTAALVHDGLASYLDADLARALFLWGKATKRMETFISEVTNLSQRGNLAEALYQRWIVDGGGQIATAPDIRDAIAALPDGPSLQSLPGLPLDELPTLPGLDPANYMQWPVTVLYPGEWTAFVLHRVRESRAIVMGGSVVDASGSPVLDWWEQAVAEPAVLDTEPPVITSASATPDHLWSPDHTMVKVTVDATVSDNSFAIWYLAGIASNQPQNGLGDGDKAPDYWTDPDDARSVWLRAERSGNHPSEVREYTITLMAIDMAGNLSAPYALVVPVVHDQG